MNERLKILRKRLNISQEKLGIKLGLTQGTIADIERGKSSLTSRNAKAICQIFHVNPQWLETGEGEMFDTPGETFLDQLAEEKNLDARTKNLINSIINLPPEKRSAILDWFLSVAESVNNPSQSIPQQIAPARRSVAQTSLFST